VRVVKRDEFDPFIDILIEYIKSGGEHILSHDTLYLCDIVEKSRTDIKRVCHEICALVTNRMKTANGLDRHKQGACFMVAVMDGLFIPENMDHLEKVTSTVGF